MSHVVRYYMDDMSTDLIAPKASGEPVTLDDTVNLHPDWNSPALPHPSWYFYHVVTDRLLDFLEENHTPRLYIPEQVSRRVDARCLDGRRSCSSSCGIARWLACAPGVK